MASENNKKVSENKKLNVICCVYTLMHGLYLVFIFTHILYPQIYACAKLYTRRGTVFRTPPSKLLKAEDVKVFSQY
jgi:hypothetical protein